MANKFNSFEELFKSFRKSIDFEERWVPGDGIEVEITIPTLKRMDEYIRALRRQEGGQVMIHWLEKLSRHDSQHMKMCIEVMMKEQPGKLSLPNRLKVIKEFVAVFGPPKPQADETGQYLLFGT